ncbi:MAG: hypothetical protein HYW86_01745 [Candidatus Roizmanbacteria bacterium]|nr:MAG: hypothetical protein HYW86_01745 [Candidatus Roizmanbacteria bacterium]
MDRLKKSWHRYSSKNITYLIFSFLLAFFLFKNPAFKDFLLHLGSYGYLGAFIGGVLFVSTFTVSIGTVILLFLAGTLNPVEIGLIAGVGAVFGDLTIFKLIRTKSFSHELKHFFNQCGGARLSHIIHSKYFSWSLPVIGALIIASPLPDEIGVSLMGISKMKTPEFILLSFILNSIGIFLVISAAKLII